MKSFTGKLGRFPSNPVWSYHIMVPDAIAQTFIEGDNRRIRCTLNDTITWPCALMPSKEGWFLLVNKEHRSQLAIDEGDEVSVKVEKDHSTYGFDMPEELEELLLQDVEGKEYFDQLTPGKQRSLVYIVQQVKNINSRMNKSLAIVEHLKDVQGNLDFKLLNQKIKYYNNLGK